MAGIDGAGMGDQGGGIVANHGGAEDLQLEETDSYIRRVSARIRWRKARTASVVAVLLVASLVLSMPFYVLLAVFGPATVKLDVEQAFQRWYDVVSPLVGTIIGAMYGLAIAEKAD